MEIRKKTKIIVITMLLAILIGFIIPIIVNQNRVIAFTADDWPYSIVFKKVATSGNNTIAIDLNGNLWSWGENSHGQLGIGEIKNIPLEENVPTKITEGINFIDVVCSTVNQGVNLKELYYNLALDDQGNIWGWGSNAFSNLGDSRIGDALYNISGDDSKDKCRFQTTPIRLYISNDTKFKDISAGGDHSLAIDEEGNIWGWGYNHYGQLGIETGGDSEPQKIISELKFKKISAGGSHSLAIDEEGNLWCWGGCIKCTAYPNSHEFTQIMEGKKFKDIYARYGGSIAIDEENKAWIWGDVLRSVIEEDSPQLNPKIDIAIPILLRQGKKIKSLTYDGDGAVFFLDDEDILWGLGHNANGELGIGKTNKNEGYIQITKKVETYNVIFMEEENKIADRVVEKGDAIIAPNVEKKLGYKIVGWYKDKDLTQFFLGDKGKFTPTSDMILYLKREPITYNISYELNGGSVEFETPILAKYDTNVEIPNANKNNAEFLGWTSSNGKGLNINTAKEGISELEMECWEGTPTKNRYFSNLTTLDGGTVTLTAHWSNNEYMVIFINGDKVIKKVVDQGNGITIPTFEEDIGYKVSGWYLDSSLTQKILGDETTYTPTDNITLYAKREPIKYNISYKLNGGDTENNLPREVIYNHEVNIPKPTKPNCEFLGWTCENIDINIAKTGEDISSFKQWNGTLTVNNYFKNLTSIDENTVELVAHWSDDEYIVTFIDENEIIINGHQIVKKGEDAIPPILEERDGYRLLWDKNYKNVNENLTVKAMWIPNSYVITITYNGNGATSIPIESQTKEYGIPITIKEDIPERTGYEFKGWGTSLNSTTAEYNGGEIYSEDNDLTLYAIWSLGKYTITYKNTQDAPNPNPTQYTTVLASIVLKNLEKEGYEFKGWYTDSSCESQYRIYTIHTEIARDLTLYASWAITGNIINYNGNSTNNDVTNLPTFQVKVQGKPAIIKNDVPERKGYTFVGWALSPESTIVSYKAGDTYTENKNLTLYAIWSLKTYTITYENVQGGINLNPTEYNVKLGNIRLDDVTKQGEEFRGWYTDPSCEEEYKITEIDTSLAMDLTLYAAWNKTAYVIKYDANGATNAYNIPASQVKEKDTPLKLSSNIPQRKGYAFNGWALLPNSTTATYNPGSFYSSNNDITLYAIWNLNTYTITYKNISNAINSNPVNYTIEDANIILQNIEREGYTFKGWYTDENYASVSAITQIDTSKGLNITLYALWEENEQIPTPTPTPTPTPIPSVEPEKEIIYYVKTLFKDETTQENTFELFNDAKIYADNHKDENIRVFDWEGHILYEPAKDDLYLNSENYKIGNDIINIYEEGDLYIYNISQNTTVVDLKNNLNTNGEIEVYQRNGKILEDNELVATNMTLKIIKNEQTIILTLVDSGDINGDGIISIKDLIILNDVLLGKVKLYNAYKIAADINGNNKISITDLYMINKILLKK